MNVFVQSWKTVKTMMREIRSAFAIRVKIAYKKTGTLEGDKEEYSVFL